MYRLVIAPKDDKLLNLIGALNSIGSGIGFRNTERAMSAISGAVATAWRKSVGAGKVIEREKISPFNHKVYSDDKMVHWLEYGLPAYDMRRTHTKGVKSRKVKPRMGAGGKLITQWKQKDKNGNVRTVIAGSSYLIIPFRHRTKNSKTQEGQTGLSDVIKDARKQMRGGDFKRSMVTQSPEGSGKFEENYWGQQIERATYDWGSRLEFPEQEEFRNLQGMVVMGEPRQSQFMTFRVVSVNSPASSWQHPGIKAKHYLDNILERGQESFSQILEEALQRDLS